MQVRHLMKLNYRWGGVGFGFGQAVRPDRGEALAEPFVLFSLSTRK